MKPMTLLLIAGAFVAGVSLGSAAPLLKAGTGIVQMIGDSAPMPARAIRTTAIGQIRHGSFLPADFRWNARGLSAQAIVCAPEGQFAHDTLPAIQHL